MAAGRPPLRIGSHGKITRRYLGGGVWLARCRYRDADRVTRIVQRLGPADEHDQHGKLAEDLLIEVLTARRPPSAADMIGLDTPVMTLIHAHIARLAEDGRAARTLDTYRYTAEKFGKVFGGVRVGEATPVSMTQDHYMARGRMHTAVAELLDAAIETSPPTLGGKRRETQ